MVFYDDYLGVLVVMGIQERAHLLEIEKIRIKSNSGAYTGSMFASVMIPHFAYLREPIVGMSSLLALFRHSTNARLSYLNGLGKMGISEMDLHCYQMVSGNFQTVVRYQPLQQQQSLQQKMFVIDLRMKRWDY